MAAAQESPSDSATPGPAALTIEPIGAHDGGGAALALLIVIGLGFAVFGDGSWNPARNLLFDAYQRWTPRPVATHTVTIVEIDDQSLAAFGRWPWPRTRLAQLIEATHRLGALAVGLDMIMTEADSQSPQQLLAERRDLSSTLRDSLAALPSNDAILANTMRQIPTVIGRAALIEDRSTPSVNLAQTPALIVGESPETFIQNYLGQLANLPEIDQAAAGRGYLNDTRDGDGDVRSMPLLIAVNKILAPAFALEVLRVAAKESYFKVHSDGAGVRAIQIGARMIPTDHDGRLRIYYSRTGAVRRVSAADILRGVGAPNALADQVAIIGVTAVGFSDVVAVPVTARMDGTQIHAQLIENILSGARLIRSPMARWWELLAFAVFGLVVILVPPLIKPTYALIFYLVVACTLVLISYALFQRNHLLYDPTFPIAGNLPVFSLLMAAGFSASRRQRRELDAKLEVERLERLRVNSELRAAREIQMGMLPDPRNIGGIPGTLDFFALLEPAQEVGGDLYDAFMLDARRLCFMIGDVSGKGVPASLFMALTKTLAKSLALRSCDPLERMLCAVNEEMSRDNPAAMFVTAIIGVADAESGDVELCNAGHNAPILLRQNQTLRTLDGANGPPLCVDEEFPYTSQKLKLEPGDMLLLITDGVSEAEDSQLSQYGTARVLECFARSIPANATQACEQLRADVESFTAGAAASDDLTIVALRFIGRRESDVKNPHNDR